MKTLTIRYLAAGTVAAIAVAVGGFALAHGQGAMTGPAPGSQMMAPPGGYGMPGTSGMPGMMGGGMMPGVMGGGMMPGMMQGMMQGGAMPTMPMMGMQGGIGPGWLYGIPKWASEDLSAEQVRAVMERRLEWHGNPRLKLGKVEARDDDWVVVDVVTVEDSLVQQLLVDRHTGGFRQAN